jgi:hypothetical protein
MKKILFSFLACIAFFGAMASSNPTTTVVSNGFNDDLNAMEQEFSGLNALEQTVDARNVTYNELAAENSTLLNSVTENQDLGNALLGAGGKGDDRALGIPGFWWGFILGLLGVLIVFLVVDNDKAKKTQVKKALIGCVVGGLVYLLLYLILVAGVLFSASGG